MGGNVRGYCGIALRSYYGVHPWMKLRSIVYLTEILKRQLGSLASGSHCYCLVDESIIE